MPHDILNTMRALREDMRQRLMQVPEYRALVALDRSIDEIGAIMQAGYAPPAAAPHMVAQTAPQMAPQMVAPAPIQPELAPQPPRQGGIASAFADALAAKMDQRPPGRAAASYLPTHRVAEN